MSAVLFLSLSLCLLCQSTFWVRTEDMLSEGGKLNISNSSLSNDSRQAVHFRGTGSKLSNVGNSSSLFIQFSNPDLYLIRLPGIFQNHMSKNDSSFPTLNHPVDMSKLVYGRVKQVLIQVGEIQSIYNKNTNQYRNNIKCNHTEIYIPSMKKCFRKYSGVKVFSKPTTRSFKVIDLTELDLRNLTCKNARTYFRHEYIINDSAVVVKMTGEVFQKKDHHIEIAENGTVLVCRRWPNCSGEWFAVGEEEFAMYKNQSIFVNVLKRRYDKFEYVWYNHTVILLCKNRSILVNATKTSCDGDWVLIENDEFQILENDSIYVNASETVYPPSKYVWQEQTLLVCITLSSSTWRTEAVVNKHDDVLSILTLIGMSMSIVSLAFVLITYSLFTELRTPPGINLMNLSVSILLAQFLWLVGSGQTDTPMACTAIAVLLHYFFLVSFVWTSIIAFDTWSAFTSKGSRSWSATKRKRLFHSLRYMAVGWLSAIVYVAICVVLDKTDTVIIEYGSDYLCWIADNNAKLYFFGIPVGLVIIFNIVFFSMTVKAIRDTQNQTNLVNENTATKRDFGMYVRISSVMGFTWAFGFAAPFGWLFLAYIFVILNSLQGVYIAIAFALSKRARKLYAKLCFPKHTSSKNDSGTVSTHITTKNGRTTENVGQLPDPKTISV